MYKKMIIKKGEYYDSITLLQVSKALLQINGIKDAAVVMGTPANKDLLSNADLLTTEAQEASANDLMIAVSANDESSLNTALKEAEKLFKKSRVNVEKTSAKEEKKRTITEAVQFMPEANLVMISVAGSYAATVAHEALAKGLNVFMFSDNVSLKDEIELKKTALQKNLFVMGPDAGTAVINGIALGFANQVSKGSIGIVAASGTGLQSVSSAISNMGSGISQAIGVGGRDISKEVGGLMMLQGIKALQEDSQTNVIVIISKPPAQEVYEKIISCINSNEKPTVICFLGETPESKTRKSILKTNDLDEAAFLAVAAAKAAVLKKRLKPEQKYFRGLFCGGSFCYETQMILNKKDENPFGPVFSNAPLNKEYMLKNINKSIQNTVLDLGDDVFTVGRLHPMMDSTIREQRLLQEARDSEVAIIYLDFVLGYGSHEDPAGSLQNAILESQKIAKQNGREIIYLASICGTPKDPQNLKKQKELLEALGVVVLPSNAAATKLAKMILV